MDFEKYTINIIGSIVGVALVYFFKKTEILERWLEHKKSKQAIDLWQRGNDDGRAIAREHMRLYRDFGIPRNAYFVSHNGGKVPTKESNFYTSVSDSWGHTFDDQNLDEALQESYGSPIKVDFAYREMVAEIVNKGHVHIKTDELENCLLKRIYTTERVAEAIVVFYDFKTTGYKFTYASHARYENDEPFTDVQINAILLSANKLRRRFEGISA